jgi:nucleoside-diphosphate-sugar epimerase
MGRDLDVDTARAKKELKWTGKVGEAQALAEIERWVREVYIPLRSRRI